MSDVKCPYCGEPQEINHDDGYGYNEDDLYHQECSCGKTFGFRTSISFHYEVLEVPCLNGGDHDWKQGFSYPVERTRDHCKTCGESRPTTDLEAARAYHASIGSTPL